MHHSVRSRLGAGGLALSVVLLGCVLVGPAPGAGAAVTPTAILSPDTALVDGQTVTVSGTGFVPGEEVFIAQCEPTLPLAGPCDAGIRDVFAAPDGSVTAPLTVRRTLFTNIDPPVDCSAAPGACGVRVNSNGAERAAYVPLVFDPDAPPPLPPTLAAAPTTDLTDGQTIDVAGSGFTPGASISYGMCAASAFAPDGTLLSFLDCDLLTARSVDADATGSFTAQVAATRTITINESSFDCDALPGACVVGAAVWADWAKSARVPISFLAQPNVSTGRVYVSPRIGSHRLGLVTVRLSAPSAEAVHVHWATADGSAVAPSDYLAGSGDLVFAPGQTTRVIGLHLVANGTRTHDEQLFVNLSAAQGAKVPSGTYATVTIPRDVYPPWHHHHHHHGWGH